MSIQRIRSAWLLAACAATAACTSTSEGEPAKPVAEKSGKGYLEAGPTLTLEEQAKVAPPTTLQLLEKNADELMRLRRQVDEMEQAASKKEDEIKRLRVAAEDKAKERDRLEDLLNDAVKKEREALEQAAAAEIGRLKAEQELLKVKLGELVRDK